MHPGAVGGPWTLTGAVGGPTHLGERPGKAGQQVMMLYRLIALISEYVGSRLIRLSASDLYGWAWCKVPACHLLYLSSFPVQSAKHLCWGSSKDFYSTNCVNVLSR